MFVYKNHMFICGLCISVSAEAICMGIQMVMSRGIK